MSGFFGESFNFDKFALKDLWEGIKKDPKRLVLGVDPWSTKAWNFVLNRDDKPLVDQMGGPYDGSVLSLGEKKNGERGGVYGRYEAQGGDASSGVKMHNIAHVIAAIFGAQGLAGIGGGGAGTGAGASGNSAFGPYASGYQWAPGSEYGASTSFGSLGGLGTSAGPESISLAGGYGSGVTQAGGSQLTPYQKYRQWSQTQPNQQEQQQPVGSRTDYTADMIANSEAGGANNPLWNAPPQMVQPKAVTPDPYAKMKEALLKQQLEQERLGFGLWDKQHG